MDDKNAKLDPAKIYAPFIGKVTVAYKKNIREIKNDKGEIVAVCEAPRTKQRDRYLFQGISNSHPDPVLIECPPQILAVEGEGIRAQNELIIEETAKNCNKHGLFFAIADHGGKSEYLYLFNINGVPEDELIEAKKKLVKTLVPKKYHSLIDMTNTGKTLIPLIGLPHWKPKYNGAIHAFVRGTNPLEHNNDISKLMKKEIKEPQTNKKKATEEIDPQCQEIKDKIPMSVMLKELTGEHYPAGIDNSNEKCPFCGDPSFSYDDVEQVFRCFNTDCEKSGNIFYLMMWLKDIEFYEVKKILAEKIGLKLENEFDAIKLDWPIKDDYSLRITYSRGWYKLEMLERAEVIFEKTDRKNLLDKTTIKNEIASMLVNLDVYKDRKKALKDLTPIIVELKKKLDPKVREQKEKFRKLRKNQTDSSISYDFEVPDIDIKVVIGTVEKHFPGMWEATEACLSILNTILLDDLVDPMSINLIGPPSSEKTTILDFLDELDPIIYQTDSFSPKAFVSHANLPEEQLEKVDLLPRIKHKCILIPELAPIFGKRKEDLTENLTIITRIFDGRGYKSDSGIHGQRGYKGDYVFTWLGASTPLPNSVWKAMGRLGNRFMFFDIPPKNKSTESLVNDVIRSKKSYGEKLKICKGVTQQFVKSFFAKHKKPFSIKWEKEKDESFTCEMIVLLAKLLTKLRATVDVFVIKDATDKVHYSYQIPLQEEPERAIMMLYNIARGRALLYGRKHITSEDLTLVFKVVVSSCPFERAKLIQYFFDEESKSVTSEDIANYFHCSRRNGERMLKIFDVLGIVNIEPEETKEEGRHKNIYTLKNEISDLQDKTIDILVKNEENFSRVWWRNVVQKDPENGDFGQETDGTHQEINENQGFGQESDTTHTEKNQITSVVLDTKQTGDTQKNISKISQKTLEQKEKVFDYE